MSGEEDDPFGPGEKIPVKVIRPRRWESNAFKEAKKLLDKEYRTKLKRHKQMPRKIGSYSVTECPELPPEFNWIIAHT